MSKTKKHFKGPFDDPSLNAFLHKLSKKSPSVGINYGGYTPVDIHSYVPDFTPAQRLALAHNDISVRDAVKSGPLLDILKQVEAQDAEIRAAGGTPEDNSHRGGFLNRTLDIISRPMYAMAEGSREVAEAVSSGEGLGAIDNFFQGALQGIEGKKKTDFIQVLQEAKDIKAARQQGYSGAEAIAYAKSHPGSGGELSGLGKVAGFGLDIIGDPLTYTGVGLVTKGKAAADLVKGADTALRTVSAAEKLSPAARDLITGAHYASGKVSKVAAAASVPRVSGIAEKVAKAEGAAKFDEIIGREAGKIPDKELMDLARQAKNTKEQEVIKNILDNYNKVVDQHVGRNIAIKLPGGVRLAVPGIPDVDLLSAATKGALHRADPVSKGLRAFNKRFVAPSSHIPELHAQKLEHFGDGMTQAHLMGRQIRQHLNPLGKSGRTEAWLAALNGHASGQLVKLGTNEGGGTVDAAEWIRSRVKAVEHSAREMELKPSDFNSWLPQGLELKREKIIIDGKKVDDPDWIIRSLRDWNMKDGGRGLWFIEASYQQARAYKSMLGSMGDTFGATIGENATAAQKALHANLIEKGWVAPKRVPELANHIFPPDIAHHITQVAEMLKDEKNWNGFWRGFAKIQRPIKFMLTLPNPSFHIHNALGDAFINHLDDTLPHHYIKSAQLLKHRNKWFESYNPEENIYPLMSRAGDPLLNARRVAGPDNLRFIKNKTGLKSADGKVHPYISQAEVYAGYNKLGLRQNYATDLGFTDTSPVGALKGMLDKITSASEAREDYFRMAHFINLIEKNPTKAHTLEEVMQAAGKRVRDTHFDYTDFTKFEKSVMSQVIPFYKWTRKALPLMAQVMITEPGKAVLVPKALRAIAALSGNIDMTDNDTLPNLQGAIVPQWMMESGYVPIGTAFGGILGNSQEFGYVPNPLTDMINQQFGGINEGAGGINQIAMNSISPIIKVLDEFRQNKIGFTGQQIFRDDPGSNHLTELLNYLASQTPITNAGNQLRKGRRDTLFNLLTGVSVHTDDEKRQLGELLRRRDVGRAILRKLRYQNGGHLPGTPTGYAP